MYPSARPTAPGDPSGDRSPRRARGSRAAGCFALGLLISSLSTAAVAGPSPQSATSTVAATVLDDCRVDSLVWNVSFGTYQMSAPATVTFAPTLHCTKSVIISSVTLDNGLNYLASSRTMSDGAGHSLPYALYTNDCASAATLWTGATTPSTFQNVTSTSVLSAIGGIKCAKIAAGVNVPSGSYADTVTITVNFT
jgi:spore coat protein U-like protein